jgi:hypothetical protein
MTPAQLRLFMEFVEEHRSGVLLVDEGSRWLRVELLRSGGDVVMSRRLPPT